MVKIADALAELLVSHLRRGRFADVYLDIGRDVLALRARSQLAGQLANSVTNQYLQATSKTKRLAQDKLVDAILPRGSLSASKSNLIQ
jgi:hypothetical protein